MEDEYILKRLKKWVPLFYGKEFAKFAFAEKKLDYYHFGYYVDEDDRVNNKVSKPLAIYLITGLVNATQKEEPKRKRKRTKNSEPEHCNEYERFAWEGFEHFQT